MAVITQSVLTNAYDATDATSYNTASITPTAGRLVLAAVASRETAAAIPTLSGNSLTWTEIDRVGNGTFMGLSLFRAGGASPTTGAVTINFGATPQTAAAWIIVEFLSTRGNTADVIQQKLAQAVGAGTSGSITLGDFANTQNATFGAVALGQNEAITKGAAFTSTANPFGGTTALSLLGEFAGTNQTTVDASWTTSSITRWIGVEIANVDSAFGIIPV